MRIIYILISLLLVLACSKDIEPVVADFDVVQKDKGVIVLNNKSTGAESYEWDFGNGQSSTEVNPTFQYDENKEYTINLTAKGKGGQNVKPKSLKVTTVEEPSDKIVGNYTGSLVYSCCNNPAKTNRKATAKFVKIDKNTVTAEITQLGGYTGNNLYQENFVGDVFKFNLVKSESLTKFKIEETILSFDQRSTRLCTGTIVIDGNVLRINFEADLFAHKYELVLVKN